MSANRSAGSPLPRFFLTAALSLLLFTAVWWSVADWAARPAALVTKLVTESVFSDLVRRTHIGANQVELETRMRVDMSQMAGGKPLPAGVEAELSVEVRPAKYGYSLPLLLALLASGSRRRLVKRMLLGAACLVPAQAFSVVMDLVKQAALGAGPAVTAQLGWDQWQLELVGYGYQLGVLLVPTLSPVLLWLWLDKQFMAAVMIEGWLHSTTMRDPPVS